MSTGVLACDLVPAEINAPSSQLVISLTGGNDSTPAASVSLSSLNHSAHECFPVNASQARVAPIVDISVLECENVRESVTLLGNVVS